MVRESGSLPMVSSSVDQVAVSWGSDDGIVLSDSEILQKQSIGHEKGP